MGTQFANQDGADQLSDLRQRGLVGPFLIGYLVQGFLVGVICNQYWTLVVRTNAHLSRRLHVFLLVLVACNITIQGATAAVSTFILQLAAQILLIPIALYSKSGT